MQGDIDDALTTLQVTREIQRILGGSPAKCAKTPATCLWRLRREPWSCKMMLKVNTCNRQWTNIKDQLTFSQFVNSIRHCVFATIRRAISSSGLNVAIPFWVLWFSVSNMQGRQERERVGTDARCLNGQPGRSNGKHNIWFLGLRTEKQMFFFTRLQSWSPRSFLPWIVDAIVPTCFDVQNLVCLGPLHWYVSVSIACVFPLQRRLRTCRMVHKFCFPAADAIKPITKLVEVCWYRSFRGHKRSKQQVRSEDSGLCCCNDQQRLPQVGRWQQDLQGTVSKISATERVKLPPCRCKCSVVMLAIDLSNSAF